MATKASILNKNDITHGELDYEIYYTYDRRQSLIRTILHYKFLGWFTDSDSGVNP